jgi:single-stranded-DNA-specific exonuclease
MKAKARWIVEQVEEQSAATMANELGIPKLAAIVLLRRGFADLDPADRFLNAKLDHFHDPRLLPDYEAAVKEILHARDTKKTIYVHGDYDVDGVTSAALFTRFLRKIGCQVVPHVPHRMKEGYGVHPDAVKAAKEAGAELFLTCDCGVSAIEQLTAAKEAGMKVVVTDHHEVPPELPNVEAVVNPHRSDSRYPFADLSGVGVVFKLCAGITEDLNLPVESYYRAFLDLAALGTIADVMPLIDENRVIARYGLRALGQSKKPGVQALLQVSRLWRTRHELTARHVGFTLGPRINAVGRISDAGIALDLLLETDPAQAKKTAEELELNNMERREVQNQILEQVEQELKKVSVDGKQAVVVAGKDWHPGLIGIVAGRVTERYHRPAFIISIGEDGSARGSARSIPGYDLSMAIQRCMPNLLSGGGHELAAGFSLEATRIEALARDLNAYAEEVLTEDLLTPRLEIDAEAGMDRANAEFGEVLPLLEPFGCANPEPTFLARGVSVDRLWPSKNLDHMHIVFADERGLTQKAMGFKMAQDLENYCEGDLVDVVFKTDRNVWNGEVKFNWHLVDMRQAERHAALN